MRLPSPFRAAEGSGAATSSPSETSSGNALILVPTRGMVMFPGTVFPVTLGRERSVAGAQAAVREERPIGLVMQRHADEQDPDAAGLHRVGTVCNILRYVSAPDGTQHVVLQGVQRF